MGKLHQVIKGKVTSETRGVLKETLCSLSKAAQVKVLRSNFRFR